MSNDNSNINVSGGLIGKNPTQGAFVKANDNSIIRVSGAVFTSWPLGHPNRIVFQAEHDGVITFVGECFSIGAQNVTGRLDLENLATSDKIVKTTSGSNIFYNGVLTGVLEDGNLIENNFQITQEYFNRRLRKFLFYSQ